MMKKEIKTCYMCEKDYTGYEHVPPKCIFPEDSDVDGNISLRKNLIKVPSCDIHNGRKSKDDEYFRFIMSVSPWDNEYKNKIFGGKVISSLKRSPHIIDTFIMNPKIGYVKEDKKSNPFQTMLMDINLDRFDSIVSHMARGLYFHEYGEKCTGRLNVITNFLMWVGGTESEEINNSYNSYMKRFSCALKDYRYKGDNKEVFKYKISRKDNCVVLKIVFYDKCEILASGFIS